jgi:hypothetical protein
MRMLAGAVMVLAGAVLSGAGAIGDAILAAANRQGFAPAADGALWGGAILVLVGALILGSGLRSEPPSR